MSALETTNEYAPPRRRSDRPQLVTQELPQTVLEPIKPMTEDIGRDALRTATIYGNTVKERNEFAAALNDANAIKRQQEIKISEQRSTIESLTAELAAVTKELRSDLDAERAECIRRGSVIELAIHALQRVNEQPGQNEQD